MEKWLLVGCVFCFMPLLSSVSADKWEWDISLLSALIIVVQLGRLVSESQSEQCLGTISRARREAFSRSRTGPSSCGERCHLTAVPGLGAEHPQAHTPWLICTGDEEGGGRGRSLLSQRQFWGGRFLMKVSTLAGSWQRGFISWGLDHVRTLPRGLCPLLSKYLRHY